MKRSKFKRYSRSFWSFTLSMLIPLLVLATFSVVITQGYIKMQIDANHEATLNHAKNTVEALIAEAESVSINFDLNTPFIMRLKSLLEHPDAGADSATSYTMLMSLINTAANTKPYIQSAYLYFNNSGDNFLVSNQGIENIHSYIDSEWYESFRAMGPGELIKTENRRIMRYAFEKESIPVITVYRKFRIPGETGSNGVGVIVTNLKQSYVEHALSGALLMEGQRLLVIREDGSLLADSAGQEAAVSASADKHAYMVRQLVSEEYGLTYQSVIRKSDLYRLPILLMGITVLLSLLSCLIGGYLAYRTSRKTHKLLLGIIDIFELAENGRPLPQIKEDPAANEYEFILYNVIKTFVEQSFLKVQLSEKKYRLQVMEMVALQSQINPHFLSNTLKTVFWKALALTNGQNEVSRMLDHLTNILTYALGDSQNLVPLGEEIAYTEDYIAIQRIRYRDKLRVVWFYDESITETRVLKLLLQPLLENSIYHGIKAKSGQGLVSIRIRLAGGRLSVTLIDNGAGMSVEVLQDLKERLGQPQEDNAEHIGLLNTYRRLCILYGEALRFRIKSKKDVGTAIRFSFPVEQAGITNE